MLATVRFLVRLIKKERQILSRYEKSHPHFMWFLGLDAVLSFALVFGGFQIAASHSSARLNAAMGHSGLIAMSANEFIDHIKDDDKSAYWLGPMAGKKYAINHTQGDVDIITYLPEDAEINKVNQPELAIETYKDSMAYATDVRPLRGPNIAKYVTASGNIVQFDTGLMEVETVTIKETLQIVEIHYPTRQTVQTLMQNAENLKLVS